MHSCFAARVPGMHVRFPENLPPGGSLRPASAGAKRSGTHHGPDPSFKYKRDDKPGYVADDHLSSPSVARRIQRPTWNRRAAVCSCAVLLLVRFTCAPSVTGRAVVSYTALPPLPDRRTCRRYISVALSLESPPPDVIRHHALRSPDFPLPAPFGLPAAIACLTYRRQFITYRLIRQR